MTPSFKVQRKLFIASLTGVASILLASPHLNCEAKSGRYKDVFTRDIYDQTAVLAKVSAQNILDEGQINNKLIKSLTKAKKAALGKKCLKRIEEEIEDLKKENQIALQRDYWESVTASVVRSLSSLSTGLGGIVSCNNMGGSIGAFLGGILSTPLELLSKKEIDKRFPKKYSDTINDKVKDLEKQLKEWIDELQNEPVLELEYNYVRSKRTIKNEKLKEEIEKALIEVRKDDYLTGITTQFIDTALNLPIGPKALIDPLQQTKNKAEILERFNNHPYFKNYDDYERTQLESIIMETAVDSIRSANSVVPKRKTYLFCGDPSSGKSTAAREVPKFFGLPYFEMTARSAFEFSQANVEGGDRNTQNPNPGWISRALSADNSADHKTYDSGFLIINDLDRILESSDPKAATAALTFLLDFTDSDKEEYYSPYFRTKVRIKYLNIIITSNRDMDGSLFYKAFITRNFATIKFRKFRESVIKAILNNYLKQVKADHSIPKEFLLTYLSPMTILVEYEQQKLNDLDISKALLEESTTSLSNHYDLAKPSFLLETGVNDKEKDNISLRELQNKMEKTVNDFDITLIKKGNTWFASGKDPLQAPQAQTRITLFKKAGLTGNPDACHGMGILEEGVNPGRSILWYKRAFDAGHSHSALSIAKVYNGLAMTADEKRWHIVSLQRTQSSDSAQWLINHWQNLPPAVRLAAFDEMESNEKYLPNEPYCSLSFKYFGSLLAQNKEYGKAMRAGFLAATHSQPGAQTLDMSQMCLSTKDIGLFKKYLSRLDNLQSLNFNNTDLSSTGLLFANILTHHLPNLTSIELLGTGVTSSKDHAANLSVVEALGNHSKINSIKLGSIDLCEMSLQDAQADSLIRVLDKVSGLGVLELDRTLSQQNKIVTVLEAVKNKAHQTLTRLSLCHLKLNNLHTVAALSKCIKACTSIQQLYLAGCVDQIYFTWDLVESLKSRKDTLTALSFSWCDFSSSFTTLNYAADCLNDSVKHLTNLSWLNVRGTKMDHEKIDIFARNLTGHQLLETLHCDMGYGDSNLNQICDEGKDLGTKIGGGTGLVIGSFGGFLGQFLGAVVGGGSGRILGGAVGTVVGGCRDLFDYIPKEAEPIAMNLAKIPNLKALHLFRIEKDHIFNGVSKIISDFRMANNKPAINIIWVK